MHFIVYGAGAVGGVVGARLHESGQPVTLVARGDHLAAIRGDGLQFRDASGSRSLRIPVVDAVAAHELQLPEPVVVLAIKSQHTADALHTLQVAIPADTPILCAQNGIDNERQTLRYFSNVYGGCVSCLATHTSPGVVQAHSWPVPGALDVGRIPCGADDMAGQIAAMLRAAGFDSVAQQDIMSWKRRKLLVNLATAVEAACGPEAARGPLADIVRAEGRAVLEAAALPLPSPAAITDRAQAEASAAIPRDGGSTWQSLQRNTGSVETDFINGEIVLLGRLHGIPTPANELVQQVANRLAAEHAAPGTIPERDLLTRLTTANGTTADA